jgi:galactokinase
MKDTKSAFKELFQREPNEPKLFIAPGRINLIGEHTDYNGGFVMPAAIDKHFEFAVAANGTDRFNIHAIDLNNRVSFSKQELQKGNHWENYLMGVIDGFVRREKNISGVDVTFSSNIPAGAGLSSSAALCSGFGFALNEIFDCRLTRLDLALIAQESEHRFVGTKCGIMDMYASLFSKEGSVMLLDCRSNRHEYLPADFKDLEILLIDTKVKHSLVTSGYNNRRSACEEGVLVIQQNNVGVHSLRDVSMKMLEAEKPHLDEEVFLRCFYVVKEMERTQMAAACLRANDFKGFGRLMYQTHWGLSKDYDVSCAESDWLVTYADENGVMGARQMGGGFGGCTINLVQKEKKSGFIEKVKGKYFAVFKKEPDFYSIKIANGVHSIDN